MAVLSYRIPGLVLTRGGAEGSERQIRDLQRDLRSLGYLRSGIDGQFGSKTEKAIKALQHDLLNNDGSSRGDDGEAPVKVFDFNDGRVFEVDGVCDRGLANCISDLLDEEEFPKLPRADDPRAENDLLVQKMEELISDRVPVPFVLAVVRQESRLKHFHEPTGDDEDTFILVGIDTNAGSPHIITSRGYGAGQYTLFHHPPRPEEVEEVMLDIGKNLKRAMDELEAKFRHFVNGDSTGTVADDRQAEIGDGPLRVCKFEEGDPRFLRDCARCALDAGSRNIVEDVTRFHADTDRRYKATQYYRKSSYEGVPKREETGCDWPYAARRYNGAGVNSYHYQARVLLNLGRQNLLEVADDPE